MNIMHLKVITNDMDIDTAFKFLKFGTFSFLNYSGNGCSFGVASKQTNCLFRAVS